MTLKVGMVLGGKYRLLEGLGEGAMSSVWLAENELLSSRVAVKVLRADLASTDARQRFEREARGVASLDSPHVVRVFDVGESDDGHPFLVMEYLRGETLLDRIQSDGLTRSEALEVVTQISRALSAAHAQGIVHRDLKPANVYVADAAGAPFVKVLDFGIAKHTRDDLELTDTGALMGTPYYMSPEQFVSPRGIDHRADLWGLAVIAYAGLLGRLPFEGETVGALSLAVHSAQFAAPTRIDPSLPEAVDLFFERALNPEPASRYETAANLAGAFAEALDAAASAEMSPPSFGPAQLDVAAPTLEASSDTRPPPGRIVLEASATHSDTTTPTSIEKGSASESRRWWPAAVAVVVVVGGVAFGVSTRNEESAPEPSAPASAPVVALPLDPDPDQAPSTSAEAPSASTAKPSVAAPATATSPSPDRATPPAARPSLPTPRRAVAPPSPSVSSPKARTQW